MKTFFDDKVPSHVHIIPSLNLGGAEKIVLEVAEDYFEMGQNIDVVALREGNTEHKFSKNINLHRVGHLSWIERMAYSAGLIKASKLPAFCHLQSMDEMQKLWAYGVQTVPVVHNAAMGWHYNEEWNSAENIPYVVACGHIVKDQLLAQGLTKKILVIRHNIRPIKVLDPEQISKIKSQYGSYDFIIGMIGRICPQKNYERAVEVLHYVRKYKNAKLVIIGGTNKDGALSHLKITAKAHALNVFEHVDFLGPIPNASNLLPTFDVFLNTSHFEGVSIATMEALASGVPVVSLDGGGQREILEEVLPQDVENSIIAKKILEATPFKRIAPDWIRYSNMLTYGQSLSLNKIHKNDNILFVTSNMDVGGAQRSLCNLSEMFGKNNYNTHVAILKEKGAIDFINDSETAGVNFWDLDTKGSLWNRASRVLNLISKENISKVVFWNMDPETKIVVSKSLEATNIEVFDVSPGPAMHEEMLSRSDFAKFLAKDYHQYFKTVKLISKYDDNNSYNIAVIPNGVKESVPQNEMMADFDTHKSAVIVGRINHFKMVNMWNDLAEKLKAKNIPLCVIGGNHEGEKEGMDILLKNKSDNLHMLGFHPYPQKVMHQFGVLVMLSTHQGSPNTSLEAISSGLPVIANADGGVIDQITHEFNGMIIDDVKDTLKIADYCEKVIQNRSYFSKNATISAEQFSMQNMFESYKNIILGE